MTTKGKWKEEAFRDQLSNERDFSEQVPVTFKYAICCGHRTGSNLLGEALYKSGLAGDPMEYYNKRLLELYSDTGTFQDINFDAYLDEMKSRRTSPNGVFGINVKMDQLKLCFGKSWKYARQMISTQDYVVFLYRRDKLRQAISIHIGQARDLFNVPAEVSDTEISNLVDDVQFNPKRISVALDNTLKAEQLWAQFFRNNNIDFEPLAYEDLAADYEGTLEHILAKCGVPAEQRIIPEQPLKKIANDKNEEFRERFLDLIQGNTDPYAVDLQARIDAEG